MTNRVLTIISFTILLCISRAGLAQFTGGLRFSHTSATLSRTVAGVPYDYSVNVVGITPFVTAESRRILVQASFTRYFNSDKDMELNFFDGITHYKVPVNAKFKPTELSVAAGYKFNAHHPLKFYPLLGVAAYHLDMKSSGTFEEEYFEVEDQVSLVGYIAGAGVSYTWKRFVFDAQGRYSTMTSGAYSGSILNLSVGIAYQIIPKSLIKERKKEEPAPVEKVE